VLFNTEENISFSKTHKDICCFCSAVVLNPGANPISSECMDNLNASVVKDYIF
jgi:hypothetical protein